MINIFFKSRFRLDKYLKHFLLFYLNKKKNLHLRDKINHAAKVEHFILERILKSETLALKKINPAKS